MLSIVVVAALLLTLVLAGRADAHLVTRTKEGDSLRAQEKSQMINLAHARYVCRRGARAHKRWACHAKRWLARELAQTRAAMRPRISGMWYAIAMCESSLGTGAPQWHINTGNGFYGGLQFLTSTWLAYGGGRYAPRADLATPAQQVAIASGMSLSHWPRCGAPYR